MHLRRRLSVYVAVAALVLSACSGDEESAPTTTTTTIPEVDVALTVTGVESNGTAPPSAELVDAVVATLDHYVADAVVTPLQTGVAGSDLAVVFTAGAAAQLDTDDREALVDTELPLLPRVRPQRADVALSTLAGPEGQIGVIVASLDLAVRATGKTHDLDIAHSGELILVPEGASWKIDSYTMHTTRERHPEPTTTTKKEGDDDE